MANTTFSVSAAGATAGQALSAASTGVHVTGTINGKWQLQIAPSDANYQPAHPPIDGNSVTGGVLYFGINIPNGWYVRVLSIPTAGLTPTFTVTIG